MLFLNTSVGILAAALKSSDEATETFEDNPNGPGCWTCHACYSQSDAVWQYGKIISGGPKEIVHEPTCWAEALRKQLTEEGVL